MKKLLLLLILLPNLLLSQEPPILKNDSFSSTCSHVNLIKPKLKSIKNISFEAKQHIDVIDYVLNHNIYEIEAFFRDWSSVEGTDVYDESVVLSVVEYFKDNVVQNLDNDVIKFITYFRAYDWIAYYNDSISISPNYINALQESLTILYSHENYWDKTQFLSELRLEAMIVTDIDNYRSTFYDLLMINLEKSRDEYLNNGTLFVDHIYATSVFIWRGFVNGDTQFIDKALSDPRFFENIFNVIDNDLLKNRYESFVQLNFIINFNAILKEITRNRPNYDIESLVVQILDRFDQTEVGDKFNIQWVSALYDVDYDFGIDFIQIKDSYYQQQFPNSFSFDDGSIIINTKISEERVNMLYLAIREARSNFFKLTGINQPVENDPNDVINMYIFDSEESYGNLGGLLFNIQTNNGGIYIEDNSSLFTFDRESYQLKIDMLLKHEYVHYLDGRYNIPGGFGNPDFYDFKKSVFWVEGLANFVSSAHLDTGYDISVYSKSTIIGDAGTSRALTLKQSINTSYNNYAMYQYSEAAFGFIYDALYEELLPMFNDLNAGNIQSFYNRLNSIANDESLEPLYQDYLLQIKDRHFAGLIEDPDQKNYDFNKPEVSLDSIQIAFNNIGINAEIKDSFQSPYKFVKVEMDTIVSELLDSHKILEDLVKKADQDFYSGYFILTTQIDSISKTEDGYYIKYSVELPLNGDFYQEVEEPNDSGNNEEETEEPVDPVDPIDPVDPEPEITELVLFPNPTVRVINVNGLSDNTQIYIYNLQGILVHQEIHRSGVYKHVVSNLPTGIYVLKYKGLKSGSFKFIKR
jgi:hypothetical protein